MFRSILLAIMLFLPAQAMAADALLSRYVGELSDEAQRPISGVFKMDFKVFANATATEPVWHEQHFIAVEEGKYVVTLGTVVPLPQSLAGQSRTLAIDLPEFGEITRQEYTFAPVSPPKTREQIIAELGVTYADIAERALFAEESRSAEDCVTIGGKSLEELDRYDELLQEVTAVRESLDQMTGARLGSRTTTLEKAGGSGGNPYTRQCPAGHVVVGMRGGAGDFVDSFELVCAPLQ